MSFHDSRLRLKQWNASLTGGLSGSQRKIHRRLGTAMECGLMAHACEHLGTECGVVGFQPREGCSKGWHNFLLAAARRLSVYGFV